MLVAERLLCLGQRCAAFLPTATTYTAAASVEQPFETTLWPRCLGERMVHAMAEVVKLEV
jgi:hypothetical protein